MSSMMMPMLFLMLMMVVLMLNPGLRILLADGAGYAIEPLLPFHTAYFVPTVFIVGSSIMVVNTIIRALFRSVDPGSYQSSSTSDWQATQRGPDGP